MVLHTQKTLTPQPPPSRLGLIFRKRQRKHYYGKLSAEVATGVLFVLLYKTKTLNREGVSMDLLWIRDVGAQIQLKSENFSFHWTGCLWEITF